MRVESHQLVKLLRGGFPFGARHWPWGTTLAAIASDLGAVRDSGGWLEAPGESHLAGLSLVNGTAFAPRADRPALQAAYGLGLSVQQDDELDRMVESISFGLGDPKRSTKHALLPYGDPAAQVRASLTWRTGPVEVTVSAWHALRNERGTPTSGGLFLHHDEAPLALPFLSEYHCVTAPWRRDPTVRTALAIRVPGLLGPGRDTPELTVAERAALFSPHLHASPTWASEKLSAADLCLWTHPDGFCGITDRSSTWVGEGTFSGKRFTLVRVRPAKGPGRSALETAEGHFIAAAEPRENSLDGVAEKLRSSGALVRVEEEADC